MDHDKPNRRMGGVVRARWLIGAVALLGCSVADAQIVKNPLRYAIGPGANTFYAVASGGITAGYRCTQAAPCTLAYAVALAQTQYDVQGTDLIIDIASGTYTEGVIVSGPMTGYGSNVGGSLVGAALVLRGHGSGSTVINASTNCASHTHGLSLGGGAYVKVGSITLQTACSGGAAVLAQQQSTLRLYDGDVRLAGADYAQMYIYGHSSFFADLYPLTVSGAATYGFNSAVHSVISWGVGVVNHFSGTYTGFLVAFDHGLLVTGITSSNSGSVTGAKYSLSTNSVIDLEDWLISALPGSTQGNVANGSYLTNNQGDLGTCVGGAVGCAVATAPTGLGAGSAAMAAGAGDASGVVVLTAGAGAAAAGVVHVATPSVVGGPGHQGGFCTASIYASGAAWDARATVQPTYTAGDLTLNWDNNAVALTNGSAYAISYACPI